MADIVSFRGIGTIKATFTGDSSLAFDPAEERGHALAGFGALTVNGPGRVALAALDARVHAVLDSVESDGKVIAIISGVALTKKGDGPLPVSGVAVVGDELSGNNGYVKAGIATDWDTLVINNADPEGIIIRL